MTQEEGLTTNVSKIEWLPGKNFTDPETAVTDKWGKKRVIEPEQDDGLFGMLENNDPHFAQFIEFFKNELWLNPLQVRIAIVPGRPCFIFLCLPFFYLGMDSYHPKNSSVCFFFFYLLCCKYMGFMAHACRWEG